MKDYFLIAVVAAGITEWVKNFLPTKLKECRQFLAGLAAIISAISAFGFVFVNHLIDSNYPFTWQVIAMNVIVVMGLSQTSYQLLVQTFVAFKKKLEEKKVANTEEYIDKKADELTEKILKN